MTANFEKTGTNDGVLTFSIEQTEIQKGLTNAFNKVKKNLNVPGFRKGKVSRQVFNRMYGEEALYEDALNDVLPAAYEAAVKKQTSIQSLNQKSMLTVWKKAKLGLLKQRLL